jgi:hypothetical protein
LACPFIQARDIRWLGPQEQPRNSFSCGVFDQAAYLPVFPGRFEANPGDRETIVRFQAGRVVNELHARLADRRIDRHHHVQIEDGGSGLVEAAGDLPAQSKPRRCCAEA